MQAQHLEEDQLSITIKPRNFKCPCSKTYLSYAALFTHIKQKHDGKPPGKITKPPSLYQKRGRPPTKTKQQAKDIDGKQQSPTQINNYEHIFPPQTQEQKYRRHFIAQSIICDIAGLFQQMPMQNLNKEHLNQIEAFSQMNVYLYTRMNYINLINGNISIADGFFQFSQKVCSKILWNRFEPFYLLFMLFLQFIIDSQNNKNILTEKTLDLFCQYINDFIENHLLDMAQYYQLQNLWIFKKQNTIRVFYYFFMWTMQKRYITFKIHLANQSVLSTNSIKNNYSLGNTQHLFQQNPEEQSENGSQKMQWEANEFQGGNQDDIYQNEKNSYSQDHRIL